jgi:hypothetical protein
MAQQLYNASPQNINLGTHDKSSQQIVREPQAIPQHTPKYYLFLERGPVSEQLVSGSEFIRMFGASSLDPLGKFYNHQTAFAQGTIAEGNSIIVKRLVPTNVGPRANKTLYLDVLPTLVDDYERNTDGSIKLNNLGQPIVVGQIDGFKVKFVTSATLTESTLGNAQQTVGDQIDPITHTQSTRYPILDVAASSVGSWGKGVGFALSAPTLSSQASMPVTMMKQKGVYPYLFKVVERTSPLTAPKVMTTLMGAQSVMGVFKKDVIDPVTTAQMDFGKILIDSYQSLNNTVYPDTYGSLGHFHVYYENIEALVTLFHTMESSMIDGFSDFTSNAEDKHLFNFVSGVSSQNVKYHTYTFVDDSTSVRLTDSSIIYLENGSDGTINDTVHAALTSAEVLRYLDPNDELMDTAYHVESVIYDSGFPIQTKKDLVSMIANRKDTHVVLGTYDAVSGQVLDNAAEQSVAIALRTYAANFPESDYFGTPTDRVTLVANAGRISGSQWNKRVPLTYQLMKFSARMMGASNGMWKSDKMFDRSPGNTVTDMYDLTSTWVSGLVRNRFWDAGLNWVARSDRNTYFFPAMKTIYTDDTSVLNSYVTVCAIAYINKILDKAWRTFTGSTTLTDLQLTQAVNDFIKSEVKDKFANKFVIVPDAQLTASDVAAGYKWTVPVKIYANNMKTVMTSYVEAYRMSQLTA